MLAASVWSLIIPSINMTEGEGFIKVLPATVGIFMGALFLYVLDKLLPHFHANFKQTEGIKTDWQKTTLLILAITLHNIPEGLAVGVLFGGVAAGIPEASIAGAVTLAIGIGLQNFPEGIAVAMPLRRMGVGRCKSFFYGQLSAIGRAHSRGIRSFCSTLFYPNTPLCPCFCGRSYDFRGGRGADTGFADQWQYRCSNFRSHGWAFVLMMVFGCGFGVIATWNQIAEESGISALFLLFKGSEKDDIRFQNGRISRIH